LGSARGARFRAHGRLLAGALRADWALSDAFFFAGAVALPEALATAQARRAASEVSRVVIREHHQKLRVQVAQAAAAAVAAPAPPPSSAARGDEDAYPDGPAVAQGDAAAAARAAAWAAAVAGGDALDEYALAATETGRRGWVRAAQRWCHDNMRDFFHRGGAARAALKAAKRAHFSAAGAAMSDDDAAAALLAAQAALDAAVGRKPGSAAAPRLRLLDVGSCHDPWRVHADEFEARPRPCAPACHILLHWVRTLQSTHRTHTRAQVTALDLRPGVDSVWRSDILALRVGPPGSPPVSEPPRAPGDGAGVLRQLPRGGFHIVVLSLVLSYIPDPLARTQARALLLRMCPCSALASTHHTLSVLRPAGIRAHARRATLSHTPACRSSPPRGSCCMTTPDCSSSSRRSQLTGANARCHMPTLRNALTRLTVCAHMGCRRSFRPDQALPVMLEWREAIEALGFARCAAARLPSVHGLAYRATRRPTVARPLAPMRIAYDDRVPRPGAACIASQE
jgi:hypothetical protein